MNKKNGFTLIELLTVMIVLAIISVIVVPIVNKTIDNAKRSTCVSNGNQYVRIVEARIMEERLSGQRITDGDYTIKDGNLYNGDDLLVLTLSGNGKFPQNGNLTIEDLSVKDGTFAIDECNLEYDGKDVAFLGFGNVIEVPTDKPNVEFKEGDVLGFNPETGTECNVEDADSSTGVNTGCMRWYILNIKNDNTLDLLLDHNVIRMFQEDDEIISAENLTAGLELALRKSTGSWAVAARYPTLDEILSKTAFYDDFLNAEDIDALYSMYSQSYDYVFDEMQTEPEFPSYNDYDSVEEFMDAVAVYTIENHPELALPGHFYKDSYVKYFKYVIGEETNNNKLEAGYITSTPTVPGDPMSFTYGISMTGKILYYKERNEENANLYTELGLKPVINVDKNKFSKTSGGLKGTKIGDIVNTLLEDAGTNTYTYMDGTYLKGNPTNNFIWYNGFMWRIMGKNQDGSIRLISNDILTFIPFGSSGATYADSYAKQWLNDYFYPKLKSKSGIVDSYFCEDTTAISDSTSKRTTCSNPVAAKVGLISLDEYNLIDDNVRYVDSANRHYYTLTPAANNKVWFASNHPADQSRFWASNAGENTIYHIRPVISVSPDTIVTSGNGTVTEGDTTEYVLNQTLDNVTGTLKKNSRVGDYVDFDGRLYRVYLKENYGTKLITITNVTDANGDTITSSYGTPEDITSLFSVMQTTLTSSSLLTTLAPTLSSKILNITWYRGGIVSVTSSYEVSTNATTNAFTNKISLPKIGELTFGSLGWTLTPGYGSDKYLAWFNLAGTVGPITPNAISSSFSATIVLPNETVITSGNGTLASPYKLTFQS